MLSVQRGLVVCDWGDGLHVVFAWNVLECERCDELWGLSSLWVWDVLLHWILDVLQVRCGIVVE